MIEFQSLLIVPVPTAEPLVESYRMQHDPSAAQGVPAHITINYPFLFEERDRARVLETLGKLFSRFNTFDFSLPELDRFPSVLFLKPEPTEPFVELVKAVAAKFPDSPPYGGQYSQINPHLTIAQVLDERLLDRIGEEIMGGHADQLPISARASVVWLMDNKDRRWIKRESFLLAE